MSVAVFIKVLFDDKSHIAKAEIDKIPKNCPILGFALHPEALLEAKLAILYIKVSELNFITFDFAPGANIDNSVSFNYKLVSFAVLKCHG